VQLFAGDPSQGVAPLAPGTHWPPICITPGRPKSPAQHVRAAWQTRIAALPDRDGRRSQGRDPGMTTERGIPAIGPLATAGVLFTSGEAELPCFIDHLRNNEQVTCWS